MGHIATVLKHQMRPASVLFNIVLFLLPITKCSAVRNPVKLKLKR